MAINFDEIWSNVKKGAGTAKSLAELKIKYARENALLEKLYKKLGKITYESFINDIDTDTTDICAQISVKLGNISVIRSEIRRIEGVNECPECGKGFSGKYAFCPFCGAQSQGNEEFPESDITAEDTEDIENVESASDEADDEKAIVTEIPSDDLLFNYDINTSDEEIGEEAPLAVEEFDENEVDGYTETETDSDNEVENRNNTAENGSDAVEEIFNINFSSDEQ